jgi:rare lipoprotein A (peptidoglycan hydrolase)
MKRRRSTVSIIASILFCLCTTGSTKSEFAFDISNSTGGELQNKKGTKMNAHQEMQSFTTPPQPKNKRGGFMCTKSRYTKNERQIGVVSWYGGAFDGLRTASGEVFNKNADTLAHLTLPMGTRVLVENPENGVIIHARVTDCGPYIEGRIADLSYGLANKLGLVKRGVGTVIITVL